MIKCDNCDSREDLVEKKTVFGSVVYCAKCLQRMRENRDEELERLIDEHISRVASDVLKACTRGNPKACSVCGSDNVVHTTTLLGVTLRYCQEHYDYFVRDSK